MGSAMSSSSGAGTTCSVPLPPAEADVPELSLLVEKEEREELPQEYLVEPKGVQLPEESDLTGSLGNLTNKVAIMEKLLHDQSIELSESRAIISTQRNSIQLLEQELEQLRSRLAAAYPPSPTPTPTPAAAALERLLQQPSPLSFDSSPNNYGVAAKKKLLESRPTSSGVKNKEVVRLRRDLEAALDKVRVLEQRNSLINHAERVCAHVITRHLEGKDDEW